MTSPHTNSEQLTQSADRFGPSTVGKWQRRFYNLADGTVDLTGKLMEGAVGMLETGTRHARNAAKPLGHAVRNSIETVAGFVGGLILKDKDHSSHKK